MNEPRFPLVDGLLLKALEELFPNTSPKKGETMEELMFRGGQRQVVDFLRAKFEAQNANLLETKVL